MAWGEELLALLPGQVELGQGARAEVAGDLSPVRQMRVLRGEAMALPAAVVRARVPEDVQAVLRFASGRGLKVVARGGGSGVVGGVAAGPEAIVLDLRPMDAIGPLDVESGVVVVEAGCILARLEERLRAHGLTTGHYPQSIGLASVGGLVATRSCGQYSTRYGSIEQMVVGLDVVTSDGEFLHLGRPPRRALGPEAAPLMLGGEGTLGVITSVTLAAWPLPEAEEFRAYAFDSFAQGLEAMRGLTRAGLPLGVIRLYDRDDALHGFPGLLPDQGVDALLLLSCLGPREVAQGGVAAADRIGLEVGGRRLGGEIARHWLETRNDVSEWDRYLSAGVLVDTVECGATWSRLPVAYDAALAAVRAVPEVVAVFAHAAHAEATGASLYFTFAAVPLPQGDAAELQSRVWDALLSAVAREGASVGHHHGVGRLRQTWTWRERQGELDLLERLRAALDPGRLLNPGALWPD
jgi:alkyldihydroxyacetonephosphate synthase